MAVLGMKALMIRPVQNESIETPKETLGRAAQSLRLELESAVLGRVKDSTPAFIEQVVVDLLIAMGYGGGNSEMGQVTGRLGDGGIDGTVKEDALGLEEVYVQVKQYATGNPVGGGDLGIPPVRLTLPEQLKAY